MTLTVAEIARWSADAVREVFHVGNVRAGAAFDTAAGLGQLPAFQTWGGQSAEAAKEAIGKVRVDLNAHGEEAAAVARVASAAAGQIDDLQRDLKNLLAEAQGMGMQIDPATNAIGPAPGSHMTAAQAQQKSEQLLPKVNAILARAATIDRDLANAINMADGKQPIPSGPAAQPPPPPPQRGQPADPASPFVGNPNFGRWEDVPPAPPYVGAAPPPLTPEYRPYPADSPLKVGPTTGMYTPGKTWIGDIDPPVIVGKEGYRFKLAGQQATTTTRMVFENGYWREQRWVQNVYEAQRYTSYVPGGDFGGLPPIQNLDQTWRPITLQQLASLSAANSGVTYYLPDGCGGTLKWLAGVPSGGIPLPPSRPIMTLPR